jgi:hypothetical protein
MTMAAKKTAAAEAPAKKRSARVKLVEKPVERRGGPRSGRRPRR